MATDLRPPAGQQTPADSSGEKSQPSGSERRLRYLIAVCAWATVLAGLGMVYGLRGYFGVWRGGAPSWYAPLVVALGLAGTALVLLAFLAVRRRGMPWRLLSSATVAVVVLVTATSIAID